LRYFAVTDRGYIKGDILQEMIEFVEKENAWQFTVEEVNARGNTICEIIFDYYKCNKFWFEKV